MSVNRLLKTACEKGFIVCPECKTKLEPSTPKCQCGWKNTLLQWANKFPEVLSWLKKERGF